MHETSSLLRVLGLGLCLGLQLDPCLGSLTAQAHLTPQGALAALQAGNERFTAGKSRPRSLGEGVRRSLARSQDPKAIIVTCADSRVVPEHIFNAGLGEIFVIRTAGNVCDPETLASIEYAAVHLGTPLCVVMAHTHCGAVAATAGGVRETRALGKLLDRIHPAVRRAREEGRSGRDLLHRAERENAHWTIAEALRRSEVLRRLVATGELKMQAAHYHLDSGAVEWLPVRKPDLGAATDKTEAGRVHRRGLPPQLALSLLHAGHQRFLSQAAPTGDISRRRRTEVVDGQHPVAIVVTCADSRVPPEHIFDAGIGELFVIRVAGNVASDEVVASIEYAVAHTGAGLCLVLGHQGCGAVSAAIDHGHDADLSPSMRYLLSRIEPSVEKARRLAGPDHENLLATAVRLNTLHFLADLRQGSRLLAKLEKSGSFLMVPAVYMLETGDLRWLEVAREPAGEQTHGDTHAVARGNAHRNAQGNAHGNAHVQPGDADPFGYDKVAPLPAPLGESLAGVDAGSAPASKDADESLRLSLALAALIAIAGLMGLVFLKQQAA